MEQVLGGHFPPWTPSVVRSGPCSWRAGVTRVWKFKGQGIKCTLETKLGWLGGGARRALHGWKLIGHFCRASRQKLRGSALRSGTILPCSVVAATGSEPGKQCSQSTGFMKPPGSPERCQYGSQSSVCVVQSKCMRHCTPFWVQFG